MRPATRWQAFPFVKVRPDERFFQYSVKTSENIEEMTVKRKFNAPKFADNGQNCCLFPPRIKHLRWTRKVKSVGLAPECHFSFRGVSFCLRSTTGQRPTGTCAGWVGRNCF